MSLYSSLTQVLAPFAAKINGLLTGWDGTRYSTPGEAVRQQIADLHVLIGDEPGRAISASAISYGDSDVGTELTNVNGRLTQQGTSIGDLSQLQTEDKTDLVSAINETSSTAAAAENAVTALEGNVENLSEIFIVDLNAQSRWTSGSIAPGTGGGTIVANTRMITSDFISSPADIKIVDSDYAFQIGVYSSEEAWRGFHRSSGLNNYSGDALTETSYEALTEIYPGCKFRLVLYNVASSSVLVGTDKYNVVSIEKKNVYSRDETNELLTGYVTKAQDASYKGKVLGIDSEGNVVPVDYDVTTDKTLSVEGKAADAKATSDVIKDTYRAFDTIVGCKPYMWTNGKKIRRRTTVIITPESDPLFCCAVIPCMQNDAFYIVATGDYNYRPYIFVDANYNFLGGAINGDPITTLTKIIAPTDAAYLILNSLISADHIVYKNESIIDKVDRNIATAEHRDNILWESGGINDKGEEQVKSNVVRMVSPYWMKAGTHIFAGIDNHFYVLLYNADYTYNSGVASNVGEYVIPSDGLYRIWITGNNINENTINAYVPTNDLLLFESKQDYNKLENDAINYVATQIDPYRISGANIKMAHDASIVFDGNDLWVAYFCDENTYEESWDNATTYMVIKKCNPYTRETIAETTFKVGDSIGSYTQATKAPYISGLTVFNSYILVYFSGYDGTELVISSFKVDKTTLTLSDYAPCTLEDANGTAHTLNCTGFSSVYASYTGTTIKTRTFGFTTQAQYYNGYWYNTLNTVFSGNADTLFIKSSDGINWTVDRIMSEVGIANEASFCILNNYVYVASRSGVTVTRYSMDTSISECVKVDIPLAISLKTALIVFENRIILASNIACNYVSSQTNNRKNFGIFEIDPQTMSIRLLTRIITQQGMHYPALASANNELWMAWSNDYRFLHRMSQRTNIAVSKICV